MFLIVNNWLLYLIIWEVLDVKYVVVIIDFFCSLWSFIRIFLVSCIFIIIGKFGLDFIIVDLNDLVFFCKLGGGWRGFIFGLSVVGKDFLIGFFGVDFYLNGIVVGELYVLNFFFIDFFLVFYVLVCIMGRSKFFKFKNVEELFFFKLFICKD